MRPTTNLEGGDGLSEEDQMHIGIQKQFRNQVCFVSCLFVYVLYLKLCILHFCVLHHSSNIHSQVLCIPCLCIYARCWSAKRIRDVWGLRYVSLKAPSYILHSTLCVCALCMHFLSLQIYFSNSLNYIVSVHFMFRIYLSSLQITFSICALCMHFLSLHFLPM